MSIPTPPKANSADPLKNEATLIVIVKFVDGNSRTFFSGDVRHRGTWRYHNLGYWLAYWKHRVENETPEGWKGRIVEAAFFRNNAGQRGDKIAQYDKVKGWY